MNILEQVSLEQANTFHVAARARYFVTVTDLASLRQALAFARDHDLPFIFIGQGSNLLFADNYPGLALEMTFKGRELLSEDDSSYLVSAQCGENWHEFVQWCLEHQYYGLENLSLIPGTVGAAPVQNIGAYGVELMDVLHSLDVLDTRTGEVRSLDNADCQFAYRDSIFKQPQNRHLVILRVTFRLTKAAKVNLSYMALAKALDHVPRNDITPALVSQTVCKIRRSKLPDPDILGNAGSFFRNPEISLSAFHALQQKFPEIAGHPSGVRVKLAAAWLIEQAGWKGFRQGDAGVHQDHALVLVNYGQATGGELVTLSQQIQSSVKDKFGIELVPEVRIV